MIKANKNDMKDAMGSTLLENDLVIVGTTVPVPGKVLGFTKKRVVVNVRFRVLWDGGAYERYYTAYYLPRRLLVVSNTDMVEHAMGDLLTEGEVLK